MTDLYRAVRRAQRKPMRVVMERAKPEYASKVWQVLPSGRRVDVSRLWPIEYARQLFGSRPFLARINRLDSAGRVYLSDIKRRVRARRTVWCIPCGDL